MPPTQTVPTQTPTIPAPTKIPLDEKILVLKKWGLTTIQSDIRSKLNHFQEKSNTLNDQQQAIALAQAIKSLKPEIDKAKQSIPPFDVPDVKLEGTTKMQQLQAVINASLEEVALTVREIQTVLETTDSSKDIVSMVQLVKNLKAAFESSHF